MMRFFQSLVPVHSGALAALLLFSACRTAEPGGQAPSLSADASRIQRDIAWLADDRRDGRGTGTAGNDSAAAYIARRHEALGLEQIVPGTYVQRFTARSAEMAHEGHPEGVPAENVVAMVAGSDAGLRHQYVVIGAHFDHLGRSSAHASDPEAKDAIRNGADDNASGTAAVMELARQFAAKPAKRSIIFASFTGEELGLLGSQWFVEHSPVPIDSIVAMVNFDMVGRLRNDKLIVYGVATATELPGILASANVEPKLVVSAVGDGFGPSDHSSFYTRGIPVLHFFTDLHDDYHKATDDTPKINAAGEARVVGMAERVVRSIADRPSRMSVVRSAAPVASAGSREGSTTYLGSIPDMSAGDIPGLKLSGVRAGSPAAVGGLETGDVIVSFGGKPVTDLYSYTDALYAHKPGEKVSVTYLRGGERRTTMITLGTRGQ
ncbi:MAG: M28 family peptidase [Gemmatimonadaceae bacterium]